MAGSRPARTLIKPGRIALTALLLAACSSEREPAQRGIGDIEAVVAMVAPDAARYVPERLSGVRGELSELQAAFDRRDYAAVVQGAPTVLAAAQGLAGAAAARKAAVMRTLDEDWSGLAARLPGSLTAIQGRIEFLAGKSNRKAAAGIDLQAARRSLADASSLWSKAQAAFAAGNMGEAVTTAKGLESRLGAVAGTLKLPLAAPGGS